MSDGRQERVLHFTLDGRVYELSRAEVVARLEQVRPRSIGTHAVNVDGTWYPVRQAFEVATGIPASLFNSHTARRHLESLGFEVSGIIQHRDGTVSNPVQRRVRKASGDVTAGEEWHTEANVQAAVVQALRASGWKVLSQADTSTKERGIDVVAERNGQQAGIEVKGFPTRTYADPRRRAETKPTQPSTQAGHWYSQAILAAMRLRTRFPDHLSVIALPDFPRYRTLSTGFPQVPDPLRGDPIVASRSRHPSLVGAAVRGCRGHVGVGTRWTTPAPLALGG